MKIKQCKIKVKDIFEGYKNDLEEGVKLDMEENSISDSLSKRICL